jgi:tol-pal system protein YbgF
MRRQTFAAPMLALALSGFASGAWAWVGDTEFERYRQSMDARLVKIETALATLQQNRQTLDLLQEVEALKTEVARLRGQAEVQGHQLETLGKRQTDLYADIDQRLTELARAPKPVVEPVGEPTAPTDDPAGATLDPLVESRAYETALTHFREANYASAIAGFKGFLKAYPDSTLASNAQYWIGYAYYALKDYKSALAHQQKLLAAYPASSKVPDAMLNMASSQIALKDTGVARKTLENLIARFPGTQAATQASRRLAALK